MSMQVAAIFAPASETKTAIPSRANISDQMCSARSGGCAVGCLGEPRFGHLASSRFNDPETTPTQPNHGQRCFLRPFSCWHFSDMAFMLDDVRS